MGKLTLFSRFLITLAIVAGIYYAGKYFLGNTKAGKDLVKQAENTTNSSSNNNTSSSSDNDPNTIKVGVVTWGGYSGGQYFNEGFDANTNSRFFKDYGFKVEFKVLDDFEASRAAWKKDEVNLLWTTADAFPTEALGLKDFEPQVVFQADWSRGGDAIVVRRGITKVSDLKGKKIAVAEMTPSHSFLLWLLDAGGLKPSDVEIVKQANAIDAAQVFKSQQVDAAVVWSPDDELCIQNVPGSRILESTKSASNIIADVFIAKKSWVNQNKEKLQQLYEGWMKGAAEINSNPSNKTKAAKILTDAFNGTDIAMNTKSINNVRLCTHGDNVNFFGLNSNFKGVTGEALYNRMSEVYQKLNIADKATPSWRLISNPVAVKNTNLDGNENNAEGQKQFSVASEEVKNKEAIATKRVSISFRSGEFTLDDNAKYIVDKEMVEIAKAFSNSRIRVEGNTDNVGNPVSNKELSLKRANAVVSYMVATYGMPKNRFIVVGNGHESPIADNATPEGKSKNRRTDFEIVAE
jgi:NitT/TauT family transport system substrate-binding protein